MNIAIQDFRPTEPSAFELMQRALDPHLLIGMPHLTPRGLSETWLMKELGHRHWLMLAERLGMDNADFRTVDGDEAYAAICATALRDAQFSAVRANDVLTIRSTLAAASRAQASSAHRLFVGGLAIGEVELVSTFVRRTREADNQSIARVALPGLPLAISAEHDLTSTASALRSGKIDSHFGLAITTEKRLRGFRFEPDLLQEFNGAGLFYFAQFQAIADRAFEHWFLTDATFFTIAEREVFFSGNVRPGEALLVELMALDRNESTAFCRIRREDGKVIGRVFVRGARPTAI